jgi:hypothetical protein
LANGKAAKSNSAKLTSEATRQTAAGLMNLVVKWQLVSSHEPVVEK